MKIKSFIFWLAGCTAVGTVPIAIAASSKPITVVLTLDWQGDNLAGPNLQAISQFRRQHPGLKFLHMVDPSYFLKPNASATDVRAKILSAFMPGDEMGLLLHPWKSLTTAAKVKFRNAPTIWGYDLDTDDCKIDCGQEVPLTLYNKDELQQLVTTAVKIFDDQHLPHPVSFRAGAWLRSNYLLEVVTTSGFSYDVSSLPLEFIGPRIRRYPLLAQLQDFWRETTPITPPTAFRVGDKQLMQMVNTAVVDYVTPKDMQKIFQQMTDLRQAGDDRPLIAMISVLQETAATFVSRLEAILDLMEEKARQTNTTLNFR